MSNDTSSDRKKAAADAPWDGNVEVTVQRTRLDGTVEPPERVPTHPITPEEFQSKARGGRVRSWERALNQHRGAAKTPVQASSRQKPSW